MNSKKLNSLASGAGEAPCFQGGLQLTVITVISASAIFGHLNSCWPTGEFTSGLSTAVWPPRVSDCPDAAGAVWNEAS